MSRLSASSSICRFVDSVSRSGWQRITRHEVEKAEDAIECPTRNIPDQLLEPGQQPIQQRRAQTIEPDQQLSAGRKNDFVTALLHGASVYFATNSADIARRFPEFGSAPLNSLKNSLSVVLGLTSSTSIPSATSSARNASLNPWRANLLAQYSDLLGTAAVPQNGRYVDDQRLMAGR